MACQPNEHQIIQNATQHSEYNIQDVTYKLNSTSSKYPSETKSLELNSCGIHRNKMSFIDIYQSSMEGYHNFGDWLFTNRQESPFGLFYINSRYEGGHIRANTTEKN